MSFLASVKKVFPGIALCVVLFAIAEYLSSLDVWPFVLENGVQPLSPVLMALLLGIALGNIRRLDDFLVPGVSLSLTFLLPLSIVFLGARMDLSEMLALGASGMVFISITIVVVLGLFAVAKLLLNIERGLCVLLAVGAAICGGAAILATAPLLRAKESDVTVAVSTMAVLGVLCMLCLPPLGAYLAFDSYQFGMLVGLTVQQTSQVVAAGFTFSQEAGEYATVIKLARVCMLLPVLVVVSVLFQVEGEKDRLTTGRLVKLLPWFLYGFLAFSVVRSCGVRAVPLSERFSIDFVASSGLLSHVLMVISMAALGLQTDLREVRAAGTVSFFLSLVITVLTIGFVIWLV